MTQPKDRRRAAQPGDIERPDRARDMRDRRWHENHVLLAHAPRRYHLPRLVAERVMRLHDALGAAGGARREHHHEHGSRVDARQPGERRQRQRLLLRRVLARLAAHHDDFLQR